MLAGIVFALFLNTGHAAPWEQICKSARFDLEDGRSVTLAPHFLGESFVAQRRPERGFDSAVRSAAGTTLWSTPGEIRGLASVEEDLLVLTSDRLRRFDRAGELKDEMELGTHPALGNQARAMARIGDLVVIARGRGGVAALSLSAGRLLWEMPLAVDGGMAVGVVAVAGKFRVIATGTRENGFNGVVTINEAGQVLSRAPYDQRRVGVVFPEIWGQEYKGQLLINNGGWIHLITATQLDGNKAIRPRWVAHAVGEGQGQHYMMLLGDFYLKGEELWGCGSYQENRTLKSKLFRVPLPR